MTIATVPQSTTSPNGVGQQQMLDHLRTYTALISPARAREILDTLNWERQRDVSASWVKSLTMAILTNELTFLTLTFAEFPNGRKVLVDGQHRLTALKDLDRSLPAGITVHRVMNDVELGELYLKYDRARGRTPDVGLRAMGITDQTTVKANFIRRLGGAVAIIASDFSRTYKFDKSLITRTHAVGKWLSEIEAYAQALEEIPAEVVSKLVRSSVGAVALATLRHQPGLAAEFWRGTATQEMLATDDPRRRLLIWLRANRVSDVGSDILYCRYVATTWNAYFENRSLKIIKVMDPSAPVEIKGTPYGRENGR